jgi:hypothetical protein
MRFHAAGRASAFAIWCPRRFALAGNFLAGLHWKRQRAASCSFKRISFSNINKQYGKQLLFVDASFQLNPGEKVGLVGPNGAGKRTGVAAPPPPLRPKDLAHVKFRMPRGGSGVPSGHDWGMRRVPASELAGYFGCPCGTVGLLIPATSGP